MSCNSLLSFAHSLSFVQFLSNMLSPRPSTPQSLLVHPQIQSVCLTLVHHPVYNPSLSARNKLFLKHATSPVIPRSSTPKPTAAMTTSAQESSRTLSQIDTSNCYFSQF